MENCEKPSRESRIESILKEEYFDGYERGLRDGIRRLEFIASTVPGSVTKKQILEMCSKEAEGLSKKIPHEFSA